MTGTEQPRTAAIEALERDVDDFFNGRRVTQITRSMMDGFLRQALAAGAEAASPSREALAAALRKVQHEQDHAEGRKVGYSSNYFDGKADAILAALPGSDVHGFVGMWEGGCERSGCGQPREAAIHGGAVAPSPLDVERLARSMPGVMDQATCDEVNGAGRRSARRGRRVVHDAEGTGATGRRRIWPSLPP